MPRKDYLADLNAAIQHPAQAVGIATVRRGDDDGWITFTVTPDPSGPGYEVTAMIADVSDYPSSHTFMLSADDAMPAPIARSLGRVQERLPPRTSIEALLKRISAALCCTDQDGDSQMHDHSDASEDDVDEPGDFDMYSDGERDTADAPDPDKAFPLRLRNRTRKDLILTKNAGFKVGRLGPLIQGQSSSLSVSCRIAKLGISEEAMQAWQILPEEYLILLIHYPRGYKTIEDVEGCGAFSSARNMIEFRAGVSTSYKPSLKETVDAFATLSIEENSDRAEKEHKKTGFRKLFISSAIHDLLNDKFSLIVKYRLMGMSWDGAAAFYHDHQGAGDLAKVASDEKYRQQESASAAYPSLVTADHVCDADPGVSLSLPLVAMQFYIRHVVRCTEYCLVCHRRMPDGLEAIKPYVCERPLCLYQYMQLGFGPSIEHEIITQPRVVDLLISLCWISVKSNGLKGRQLPKGLGLRIPSLDTLRLGNGVTNQPSPRSTQPALPEPNSPAPHGTPMRLHLQNREILFDKHVPLADLRLKVGDWIVMRFDKHPAILHCRIEETSFFPVIKFATPIILPSVFSTNLDNGNSDHMLPGTDSGYLQAYFLPYSWDFDSLPENAMCEAITLLLDLLPSVRQMREYLTKTPHADLKAWTERIPPAALGLLRWIVASNRACIMQIDGPDDLPLNQEVHAKAKREERVHGMPGYLQFRIAMGAPDKERRFIESVKSIASDMNLQIPTMFAWHGSPLQNWHSIIREGLHFEKMSNGRAFGNGVYFAKDSDTSIGYSTRMSSASTWALSEIKVCNAISLNEIVNAPSRFVHSNPYLVVKDLDWIQTRYLFVQQDSRRDNRIPPDYSQAGQMANDAPEPANPIDQDPLFTPKGLNRSSLIIPASAIPSSRRRNGVTTYHAIQNGHKKIKAHGTAFDPIDLDDDEDSSSITTEDDDRNMLILEKGTEETGPAKPLTDFVPGQLSFKTLPMMKMPEGSSASSMATKRLNQDFQALLKIQESQPLHELGWYIDDKIMAETENLYQWIVELHSFEASLPLAKDMKEAGLKSIVLEMRFGKEYPMAPPFVRIIRPRFLPFMNGGGGHVTGGGALCMELLTNDGWSAVSSIESVLMQVRLALSSNDPRPARLEKGAFGAARDYSVGEAVEAYIRACNAHGWRVPPGFKQMVHGSDPASF